MPNKPLSPEICRQTLELLDKYEGNQTYAARAAGIPRKTFADRVLAAREWERRVRGGEIKPQDMSREQLLDALLETRALLKSARANSLDDDYVRQKIIGLTKANVQPPSWLIKPSRSARVTGVPTLFCSDWHHGEVVDPRQINGVNEYNMAISHRRMRRMIEKTIHLTHDFFARPSYDGIVFALGGDMVSGDIHEELEISNERPIMPVVVDMIGQLIWCVRTLADKFGRVFVPCVTGNHGRNHRKVRAKNRNFTNFDWLIYSMLEKAFESDSRVSFLIPDGSDVHWAVYGHRYCMTHGDQFRGGDGMIGMLGPVTRGDMKKRARNAQINMEYDTLLIGHWHQLHMGTRVITNGSGKGYDEWAASMNFGFEVPQQALWITHPIEGITFRLEVHLEDKVPAIANRSWVAVST